jgi:RNA polymerase sigma factor (sigma-70 family)
MDIELLFIKWRRPIKAWLRNRAHVPPVWIDDLAQEVFIRLLKYAKDTEIESNAAGYIFRTAANVANEWRERSAVRCPHVEIEEEHCGTVCPDEDREHAELVKLVQIAMSKLPSRQLLILMMYVYEDKTYKEIAKELDCTYRLVLRELTRAYSGLRILLQRSDVTDILMISSKELKRLVDKGINK